MPRETGRPTQPTAARVTMRPFMNIDKESYSTYVMLKS